MPPPSLLADSINAFSKAALKAVRDLDHQLAQAHADARDAQKVRDNTLKLHHASQLQLEAQNQDTLKYRHSLAEAQLTLERQADMIAQLQRDVGHWKEQARNWQEHFTRVEEERCSLSTKLDEILTTQALGPVITSHLIAGIETPMKRTSTSYFSNPKTHTAIRSPESEPGSPEPDRKPKARGARRVPMPPTKARKPDVHTPKTIPTESPDPPLSRLVRRVQAVVQVKSEDDWNTPPSDGVSLDGDHEQDSVTNTKHDRNTARRKSKRAAHDDDEWSPDGEKSQLPPSPSKNNHDVASDDEDELILGRENPRHTAQTVATQPNIVLPNKKRKLNNSTRQKPLKKSG